MKAIDERKVKAARLLAQGATLESTASSVGVDKSTIVRWRQNPEFRQLQESEAAAGDVAKQALEGLEALVPKALDLLDRSLSPGSGVAGNIATNALNIVKTAAAFRKEGAQESDGSFEALLTEIEGGEATKSD